MSMQNAKVEVVLLFPISERRVIYAHLKSFDWDFTFGIEMRLCQGGTCLQVRQVGYGSAKDQAVVMLSPLCDWSEALETVENLRNAKKPIYLERDVHVPGSDLP